ncbi:MAG TPA: sigma-70 family RNA polymerase sigma factor [Saprospiraceae bacterium]|nr:sigma-70 family RNA polymerase sigma factor [Saprospiraceae bacterium]
MKKADPIGESNKQVDHLFREVSGKVVAVLMRRFGVHHIELIMDAVQDAFEAGLIRWRYEGLPKVPEAWLMTVAHRKLLNQLRKESHRPDIMAEVETKMDEAAIEIDGSYIKDSQLRLLLVCVNLPLSRRDRIITTLHILCGFSPAELARAMGLHFEAVRKSLYRNKLKLAQDTTWIQKEADIHIAVNQIPTLLEILYALFNEGYKSQQGDKSVDISLCYEALRLLKLVNELVRDTQIQALLALFYFHLSRFPARMDVAGDWLTLEEQDRQLWDEFLKGAGFHHLALAKPTDRPITWYLEAVIASLHAAAPSFDQTPWKMIEQLYTKWHEADAENPMVRLQALTAAIFHRADLQLVNELEALRSTIEDSQKYMIDATIAGLYEKLGYTEKRNQFLRQAIDQCNQKADIRWLKKKMKQ